MVRIVLSLTIVLAATNIASAATIYVNNQAGNDLSDGTSPQPLGQNIGPVRTIAKGLRLSRKGDRVVLANTGQPYRECITLQAGPHSGWANQPFILQGNGATLDGSIEVSDFEWEHSHDDIFRFQPKHTAYHQLFRDGLPLERVNVTGYGEFPELEPLQWCLFDRYVYFRVEPTRLPESYQLTHSGHRVGITLYMVRHVVVQDLIVQGFQLDGINCHSNVHNGTLLGITSRGNGRSGVSIGGASRVALEASLIGNNGAAQLRVEGFARVETINNNLLANTAPAVVTDQATVINRDTAPPAEGVPAVPGPAADPVLEPAPAANPVQPEEPPADDSNPFGF